MLCPETLVTAITAVAIAMAEGRSEDDVGFMGTVLTQLGDTLQTIAASRQRWQTFCNDTGSDNQNANAKAAEDTYTAKQAVKEHGQSQKTDISTDGARRV